MKAAHHWHREMEGHRRLLLIVSLQFQMKEGGGRVHRQGESFSCRILNRSVAENLTVREYLYVVFSVDNLCSFNYTSL